MQFDNPIFILLIIIGPIFILTGFILLKFPPKKINLIYGYRTGRSMKNQASWDFAQKYAAKSSIKAGAILTVLSVVGLIINPGEIISLFMGLGVMIIVLLLTVVYVESALKKNQ